MSLTLQQHGVNILCLPGNASGNKSNTATLTKCWASVIDGVPALKQRWLHVIVQCYACLLGQSVPEAYRVLGYLLVVVLFAPNWGGSLGICSVCWMLCMALYGSTSLQQSSKGSCSLLVSCHNLRADCQWHTLVPLLNSGANTAPASVLALM